ncbi:helix-turn-helix domain-containing protein [Bacillus inaquosorum]|uniref:helix-turn-helix domain-containing protein n=1 Tax=Bacillus inaquosorum TaxID=483913 RepID=UPI0022804082|nr:helix-turn-helix transcriptional regulator [Bacillus inaquosorum]MCY9456802.1 helix-turn-helix domain-containing protein [Bacillus inaquosorum]
MNISNENFKLIRLFKGMTQAQFANYLGISPTYVSMIENGTRTVSTKAERVLAMGFEVTDDFLEFVRRYKLLKNLANG